MKTLGVSLLLIMSAIAVVCVVLYWLYRVTQSIRKAKSDEGQERAGQGRTETTSAGERELSGLVRSTEPPRHVARAPIGPPQTHIASTTDTVQDTAPAIDDLEDADRTIPADEGATVSDHGGKAGKHNAIQVQRPISVGQEPTEIEAPSLALLSSAPDTSVTECFPVVSSGHAVEAMSGSPAPVLLHRIRDQQQLAPPLLEPGVSSSRLQSTDAPLATHDEGSAQQTQTSTCDNEQESVAAPAIAVDRSHKRVAGTSKQEWPADAKQGSTLPATFADAPPSIVAERVTSTLLTPSLSSAATASIQRATERAEQTAVLASDEALAPGADGVAVDQEGASEQSASCELQRDDPDDAARLRHHTASPNEVKDESLGAALELSIPGDFHPVTHSPSARQAVHRDRRGRQPSPPQIGSERKSEARKANSLRPPAEARLRLMLHPIRRTAGLALVLMRPADFPEQATLELNGLQTIEAIEEGQYGDVELSWDAELLQDEIRVSCIEGYQWVRSARPAQIFVADPAQADLVSVPAATAGMDHTIICRATDAVAVCDVAESAGSARPVAQRLFTGIPDGWVVLSGYRPTRAAALRPAPAFSPLDPGHGIEITLRDGMEIGRRVYAQGRPPRIVIKPMLEGIVVRIGGATAAASAEGNWEAPGWDAPGPHRIEVVPGPSLNYEVQADPGVRGSWAFWDAHSGRTAIDEGPWSRAQICGALLTGPSGKIVVAAEPQPTILALSMDGSVDALRLRLRVRASVGFATSKTAFLLISSGRRRRQGKIVWLGLPPSSEVLQRPRRPSDFWVEAVRSAASRRLAMEADEAGAGQAMWQAAVRLARAVKRKRNE